MPKRFPPLKGTKKGALVPREPSAKFAYDHGLITKPERDACVRGDMQVDLKKRSLFNFNASKTVTTFATGLYVRLYLGRGEKIAMAQLLGLELPEEETFFIDGD